MAPTNLKKVEDVTEDDAPAQPQVIEEVPVPKFGESSHVELLAMLQDENVHLRAHARRQELYINELLKRVEDLKGTKKK